MKIQPRKKLMQPDHNSLLPDAIRTQNIEAISTLIQQGAELTPSLISSTGLDDAAQTQFEADKTKLLESFYAIFNKHLGSSDKKNRFIQHCIDLFEQATVLRPQLNNQDQDFLDNFRDCCQAAMLSKLKSWREALREYSALEGNPKNDHIVPVGQYEKSQDGKEKRVYNNKEKMMMLRFVHRFTTHNRFTEPQEICQDILNSYTSHPDSPDFLKNITVLPAGAQSSATAKEITLEMALRLCADLVRTGLRPGHYSGNDPLHAACWDGSTAVVELLLKNGAAINAKDHHGNTALHSAVKNEKTQVVNLLLKNGADINAKDDYGDTPLHWAAITEKLQS